MRVKESERESERDRERESKRKTSLHPILKGKYQLVILGAMTNMKHSEFQLVSTFLNCILSPKSAKRKKIQTKKYKNNPKMFNNNINDNN